MSRSSVCILALFVQVWSSIASADCKVATGDLAEGKPIVKVSPVYPRKALRKGVEACVILSYSLIPKPGAEGEALIPGDIDVVSSTEDLAKPFVKASKRALRKWLFLTKNHPDPRYSSAFPFELKEEE